MTVWYFVAGLLVAAFALWLFLVLLGRGIKTTKARILAAIYAYGGQATERMLWHVPSLSHVTPRALGSYLYHLEQQGYVRWTYHMEHCGCTVCADSGQGLFLRVWELTYIGKQYATRQHV